TVSRQVSVAVVVRHRVSLVGAGSRICDERAGAAGGLVRQWIRIGPIVGPEDWIQPENKAARGLWRPSFEAAFGLTGGCDLRWRHAVDISRQSVVGRNVLRRRVVPNVEFTLAASLAGVRCRGGKNLIAWHAWHDWIGLTEAGESAAATARIGTQFDLHMDRFAGGLKPDDLDRELTRPIRQRRDISHLRI